MKRKQSPAGDNTGGPPKDSAASLYDSGSRHSRSGRYPIAEERMRRVLLLDPEHADALYLMGLLHARANKIDRAIDFVVRASRINQGNPEYFVSLGELLGSQDRLDEALKCYNVALKLKPDCADVWVKVGDLQRRQERFEEALFAYEHALVVDPRHLDAADKGGALLVELRRFEAAALALQAGRPDDAELACRQILRIVPTHDGSMNLLGIIALQRGKFALARDCLEKALAQDSQNSIYHANLAKVLVALACPNESESHLREASGVSFVSLQKGEAAQQTSSPSVGMKVHDWTAELHDFADTAALISVLDLVITVDTSIVHLAGALGRPVWLLNRFNSCWRWQIDSESSPWYKTLRQFKQPGLGDWASVVGKVKTALAIRVAESVQDFVPG